MIVPLGKYKNITQKSGLYSVIEDNKESYNKYLINGNGKALYDLDGIDINSLIGIDTFLILDFDKEDKYVVINYKGKELISFPKVDDSVEEPFINEEDGYISIFYNNKNWIFNVKAGRQLALFDSELHYCVNEVSNDENIIILNYCGDWFQNQDKTYYKFIRSGKLYDKTNECDKVTLNSENLFCYKEYDKYLLDSNLNITIEIYEKAYNNSNCYVMNNPKSFKGVDFYQNGKIVKNVSCRTLKEKGYMESDIYLLSTYDSKNCGTKSGMCDYYKFNGEKLVDKSFKFAGSFDLNDLAIVSEDKINYYLIDKAGKQVGGVYTGISLYYDYYLITKDKLTGIMDKEGKEIILCEYLKINIITNKDN